MSILTQSKDIPTKGSPKTFACLSAASIVWTCDVCNSPLIENFKKNSNKYVLVILDNDIKSDKKELCMNYQGGKVHGQNCLA